MRSFARTRTVVKLAAALTIAGSSVVGFTLLQPQNVSSSGIVRFGRAAVAVARIVVDYKSTLRDVDPTSEQYLLLKSEVHLRSAERLREMCWRNGGCFIKVGQHIGALDYLLPAEYVNTMKVLHQYAPESSIADIKRIIATDLGHTVDELFASFEERPIASASLAQVHRATTRGSGDVVAVKVQHPHIKAHSAVDMATMEFGWLAEETRKNLPLELDFEHEARNCDKVAKSFAHLHFLKIPSIYWQLTSERVLTMEFCHGGFITDTKYIRANNISIDDVMTKLGRLYSEMIFVQGYIHCDPHPGNLLVRPSTAGTEIVLLDHGLYQTMSNDVRLNYCRLWQAILRRDETDMKEHSRRLGIEKMYPLFICIVTGRSWDAVTQGVDQTAVSRSEADIIQTSATSYLPQITTILNTMSRQLLLIFKTNDLLRGIESSLRSGIESSQRAHQTQTAFIAMSRCCIRAVGQEQAELCRGRLLCRLHSVTQMYWILLKLSTYEVYLQLKDWVYRWIPGIRGSAEKVYVRRLGEVLLATGAS